MFYNVKRMCIKSSPEGGGGKSLTPDPSPKGEGREMRDIPMRLRNDGNAFQAD